MPQTRCSTHRAAATHRCDGCERYLCEECIEVGHRLLFCKSCGERALPLADEGPANALELGREHARATPYTPRDALLFPLRGQGALVGLGAVVYLVILRGMLWWTPFAGFGAIPLLLLILMLAAIFAVLAAGLSFAIVRSTAGGGDEVPDWPDWSDFGERFGELLAALVLGLMTLLPAIVLIRVTDCEMGLISGDLSCVGVMFVGLLLGMPLWIPAFGAVGVFGNMWLAIRWDLHVRALIAIWTPTLRIAVVMVGLYLLGGLAGAVLSVIPLVGWLAALVVDTYTWLFGMHLIGLLMRAHEQDLEPIYFK